MAERRPPGFNVPLGFYDGPEVNSIPRRIRPAAVGVWTLCGTYSANKLQDGYVGPEMLKQLGCTPAIRAALKVTRGPDGEPDPLWIDARDSGIQFTKWFTYQRSRAEVKAYRKADAERKKAERDAKRNGASSANIETSDRTSNGHPPDHRDPKTKTKTEKESGVTNVGNSPAPDNDQPPPRFCPTHPDGTDSPCGACANARRKHDEWQNTQTLAAVNDRQQRLADIAACPDCDDAGWADADESVTRCEHPKVKTHV